MRFVICSRFCQEEDIHFAWNEISGQAFEVLQSSKPASMILNKENETLTKDNGDMVARFEGLKLETEEKSQLIS